MKSIKIGKLTFSRKTFLTIAFGLFCTGIILGAFIALSHETDSNFNFPLFLLFNVLVWFVLRKSINIETE
jgi:FtsH-binding integral membrane protein